MKRTFIKYFTAVTSTMLLLLIISCSKENGSSVKPNPSPDRIETLTSFLINQGFCSDKLEFKDESFMVEGDIRLPISDVEWMYKQQQSLKSKNARPNQYKWFVSVNDNYIYDIDLYLQPSLSSDWKNAMAAAVNEWNALGNTKVRFYFTDELRLADVNVIPRNLVGANGVHANGSAQPPSPSDQRPGNEVLLDQNSSLSSVLKRGVCIHELGHIIGLCHTDDGPSQNCLFINGTLQSDQYSIMNAYANLDKFLSEGDKQAVRILYPGNAPSRIFASVVFRNRQSSPPDQNGGDYSTASMFIVLTNEDGSPYVNQYSGIEVQYKESASPDFQTSVYSNVQVPYGVSEIFVGEKSLADITCSDPQHCSGSYHYYKTVLPDSRYSTYRPKETYY